MFNFINSSSGNKAGLEFEECSSYMYIVVHLFVSKWEFEFDQESREK